MATIAVFEDLDMAHDEINEMADRGNHEVVARAWSISEAHELLTQMAMGEVQADYTLLDGTLAGYEKDTPDYIFQPIGQQTTTKRTLLGKTKEITVPLNPIIIPPTGRIIGQHGRQISEAIKACQIPTTTIGISSDPAETWNMQVDYDLTKALIRPGLLSLISSIEAKKHL